VAAVAAVADRRGHRPEVGLRAARELFVHQAVLDGPVVARTDVGPALTVLRVDRLDGLQPRAPRRRPLVRGGGPVAGQPRSLDRAPRSDPHPLRHSSATSCSRWRSGSVAAASIAWCPVGQALQLARFWDGYDLGAELVRNVHVVVG
jgi:hypothetical protein